MLTAWPNGRSGQRRHLDANRRGWVRCDRARDVRRRGEPRHDINDVGFVVGWVRNSSSLDNAFFWQSGTFTALPPGPYDITSPTALTNLVGNLVRVVGASTHSTTAVAICRLD